MEDSYFETFSFQHPTGISPLYELTVTNCSPGLSAATPNTTDPITGQPISSYSSMGDAAHAFAAELDRRHQDVFGHGGRSHTGAGAADGAHTPEAMLMPLRKRALQRLSFASSIASSAPSTTTSEVDGSEDLDREHYSGAQHYQRYSNSNVSVSDSTSTIATMPELVSGKSRDEVFDLSDFIADSEAVEFANELDRAVDSAQALTLRAASYTTPQRPSLFRRTTGEQSSSVFGTQSSLSSHLSISTGSSPESSPGSPCTPASVFDFDQQQEQKQQKPSMCLAGHIGNSTVVLSREVNDATLRARRNVPVNNANRQSILGDPESLFSQHLTNLHVDVHGEMAAEKGRAGLGLFGIGQGQVHASNQNLSRSGSLSVYDTLSCNPADIAPVSASPAGDHSPALVDMQQASSSSRSNSSGSGRSSPSVHNIPLPSPTFPHAQNTQLLYLNMPSAIVRSPVSLYATEGIYRSGSPASASVSVLSSSLPNPNYAPPSPSPLSHGFHAPQRPGSSLGPMRRASNISAHSASPYSRTIELVASGSPLPMQRHFTDSPSLVLTSSLAPPTSPALSAHSGISGTSASSVSSSGLSQFTDPVTGIITKRSRGRRVPNNPDEMNNLGKSGKVYTCKVPGCGKCFKRSEHLKRHVRSIHTDDKPYTCPFPGCGKNFSRHDNLNQHARVHNLDNIPVSATLLPHSSLSRSGSVSSSAASSSGCALVGSRRGSMVGYQSSNGGVDGNVFAASPELSTGVDDDIEALRL